MTVQFSRKAQTALSASPPVTRSGLVRRLVRYDFRLVRAQIAAARRRTLRIMVQIVRRGKEIAAYHSRRTAMSCGPRPTDGPILAATR